MNAPDAGTSSLQVLGVDIDLKSYLELLRRVKDGGVRPLRVLELCGPKWFRPVAGFPGTKTVQSRVARIDLNAERSFREARRRVDTILANRYDSLGLPGRSPLLAPSYRDAHTRILDANHDVRNLILHAESEGIEVTWGRLEDHLGGFVMRSKSGPVAVRRDPNSHPEHLDPRDLPKVALSDVLVMLNKDQTWATTFDVLVHELSHVLLGHIGTMRGHRRGRLGIQAGMPLTTETMEFEVHCVGFLVSMVRGGDAKWPLMGIFNHYVQLFKQRLLEEVNVLEVFIAAEVLCAWCASGPDRLGVLGRTRRGPDEDSPATEIDRLMAGFD